MKEFSERIKQLRSVLKMTQAEFAKPLGLTQNTITKYENGLRHPNNIVINSICMAYNVNEEWIKYGHGEIFNKDDKELEFYLGQISADDDEFKRSLIKSICKLSPDEWNTLKKIVSETYKDSFRE